ncbi:hypothetical protein CHH72_20030 [Shouchella clausii]|uniref:Uncharacterized protein n=1 Tax=Shouchella clausii TaxID=79880 RepID=A0A268NVK2_SHOCL|nr:hypothetical protein CHH72_20030 [Shouchella clausii]
MNSFKHEEPAPRLGPWLACSTKGFLLYVTKLLVLKFLFNKEIDIKGEWRIYSGRSVLEC